MTATANASPFPTINIELEILYVEVRSHALGCHAIYGVPGSLVWHPFHSTCGRLASNRSFRIAARCSDPTMDRTEPESGKSLCVQ